MPTSRVLNGALRGFLSSFTSRYSDWKGYWVFGFLFPTGDYWKIDLLNAVVLPDDSPIEYISRLARIKFKEQVEKVGLEFSRVTEAHLEIKKTIEVPPEKVDRFHANGFLFSFTIEATTSHRLFRHQQSIIVAPHDPKKESRRYPEQWGT